MIHRTDLPSVYATGARCIPVWFPQHNCYHWVVTEFNDETFLNGNTLDFPAASSPNINGMYNYHQKEGADPITEKDAEDMVIFNFDEEKDDAKV